MSSAAILCLAMNIYFEARGEPDLGQYLVAEVTMNRVHSQRWKPTVCRVVHQPKQFSWTAAPYEITETAAFNRATHIALQKHKRSCVDHYHNFTVQPDWADNMTVHNVVGNHIFYCSGD